MPRYVKTRGGRRPAMKVGSPAEPSVGQDEILPVGQELRTGNLQPENIGVQNTAQNQVVVQNKKPWQDLRSLFGFRHKLHRLLPRTSPGSALLPREQHSETINRPDSSSNKRPSQESNVEMDVRANEVTMAQSAINLVHHYDTTLAVTANGMEESEEVAKRQQDGVQNRASDLSNNSNSTAASYSPPQPHIDSSHVEFSQAVNIKIGKEQADIRPVMLFLDTQSTHNFVSWSFLTEYRLKARPLMKKDLCVFQSLGGEFIATHYSDLVLMYWSDGIEVVAKAKFYVTKVEAIPLLVGKSFITDEANRIKLDKPRSMYCLKAWAKKNGKVSKEVLDRQEEFLRQAEAEARAAEAVIDPSTTGSTSNPSGTSQGQQHTSSSQTDASSVSNPNTSTK